MLSNKNIFMVIGFVFLASVCFAEETAKPAAATDKPTVMSFPYIAQVTGANVYIRSGAGKAFYYCTKLSAPAKVLVVDQKYGYSKIAPPKGSYSWISTSFVKADPANPGNITWTPLTDQQGSLAMGSIALRIGSVEIGDMRGLGRRMPVTMTAFFIASLSIIGLPPLGGFWSKWFLALGTLDELRRLHGQAGLEELFFHLTASP